jgi:hypothetical protein
LHVAFHFDADAIRTKYKVPYHFPILEKIFRTLLDSDFNYTHIKIANGNLFFQEYLGSNRNQESIKSLSEGLLGIHFPVWRDVDERFLESVFSKQVFVVALEGLNFRLRDILFSSLKEEDSYLGAIQIYGANKVHWDLYNQSLIPQYRYIDKELRIFYSSFDEDYEENKDSDLKAHWRRLPFKSIRWENLGARHTALDAYDSFKHAKRLAALSDILSDHLLQLVDDVLLRTGDLDANLQNELYSALRTFSSAQTISDIAQVAISCRRFIESLADTLYTTFEDKEPLLDSQGKPFKENPYLTKYYRYIKERLGTLEKERKLVLVGLEDLDGRIRRVNDLANKGLHHEVSSSDLNRLLLAMVIVIYDVISLAPPPMELPLKPHEGEFMKLVDAVRDEHGI